LGIPFVLLNVVTRVMAENRGSNKSY